MYDVAALFAAVTEFVTSAADVIDISTPVGALMAIAIVSGLVFFAVRRLARIAR